MSRVLQTVRGRRALVWAVGAAVLLYGLLMAASFLDPGFAGDDVPRNVTLGGEDAQRVPGRLQGAVAATGQRRLVRSGDNNDGFGQPVLAQLVFQKFLHLASALPDKADDIDIRAAIARQHRHQNGFPDA